MIDPNESLPAFRPARIAGDGDADSKPSEAPTHERRVPPVGADPPAGSGGRAEDEPAPQHPRYTPRGVLGSGGQGIVYRVFDRELGREVALKTIRPRRVSDETVSAFLSEVRAAASLDHPNIVPIYDAGRVEDGRPFYTMRLVEGRSLHSVFKALASGAQDERERATEEWSLVRLVQVVQQTCRALQLAHEREILHRDVKPANILLGRHGEVLVVDWGIAKFSDPDRLTTATGIVRGTAAYMSPEQASGETLDARADVYALGVVLFQALTLKLPFQAPTDGQLLAAILRDPPPKPEVAAGARLVPSELSAICLRALSKSPAARPSSALALHDELQAYVEGMRDRERRRMRADTYCSRGENARLRHDEAVMEAAQLTDELANLERVHPPWQPIEEKRELLAARTHLAEARERVETTFTEAEAAYSDALAHMADHRGAREAMTSLHWKRFAEAEHEGQGKSSLARASRAIVERYHDGTLARELQGDGLLDLEVEPRDAEITLHPLVEKDLVLVDGPGRRIGRGSVSLELGMGSYVLVVKAPGHESARYPVCIERNTHWKGTLRLLKEGAIPEGFIYIPGAEAWLGGDPLATNGWPLRRVKVESFLIGRHPVTFGEYCEFLNALAEEAPGSELPHVPRTEEYANFCGRPEGSRGYTPLSASAMLADVVATYSVEALGRLPIFGVTHANAEAYCAWCTRRSGREHRLPSAEEREFLACGVDRRPYAWGHALDSGLCHVRDSLEGAPQLAPVGQFRGDISVHGVSDLGGCMQEATASKFAPHGDMLEVRGGGWGVGAPTARSAWRGACTKDLRNMFLGFRVAAAPWP